MGRLTKLQAVNQMLAAISESPVSSLKSGSPDAVLAIQWLDNISRQVQASGFWFNFESNYPLKPDVNCEIHLPRNTLSVDEMRSQTTQLDLVQRGDRLYDKTNRTYQFKADVVLQVDIILQLDFDELPNAAAEYIAARAARVFQDKIIGDATMTQSLRQDEQEAKAELRSAETANGDFNIFNNRDMQANMNRDVVAPYWLY